MNFFSAENITAGYGQQNIMEGVSFCLENGSLTGIVGANGSGKTTLLKALCGILPHAGQCQLSGEILERLSPRQLARLCSYIPQRSGISIDISVLDVVLMGFNPRLGLLEQPTKAMKEKALTAIEEVGLSGKEHTNYLNLSEGQKQLCILARTLVSDSKLLLLDEPESALDFRFRYQMLAHLRRWVSKGERAAVAALHDPMLALNCCDKLLVLHETGVQGVLRPREDSLDKMEQMLSMVYGNISLQRCVNRSGQPYLVMLKEDGV